MAYQHVFLQSRKRGPVQVAVIGAGSFGSGIVAQSVSVPSMRVNAVADTDLKRALRAYEEAGFSAEQIAICETATQVAAALKGERCVVTQAAELLFDQPVDVIVEATGSPEAGARHAAAALAHGKHVAMVTKETDAAVGPILKHRADRAGLVYTAVDGDQHGLLTGLVLWARMVGLEVLCGGKILDNDWVLESSPPAIRSHRFNLPLNQSEEALFRPFVSGKTEDLVAQRARKLGARGGPRPWDLAELTIAANSTALAPDVPRTHCPVCWTTEIPALLCPAEFGGLLGGAGRIEAVRILRQPHEASLGGGVFVVVRARTRALRDMIRSKGVVCQAQGEAALLLHPYHLLGVEAIGSILAAGLGGAANGAVEYLPRFDVVYRAARPLQAGACVGSDHSPELTAEIVPAVRLTPDSPLPADLAQGNRLRRDVAAGDLITGADVEPPAHSTLWALREEQQRLLLD